MNRRDFLQAAAVVAAGVGMAPSGLALSAEQQAFLAAQPDYIDRGELDFFTASQRATVAAVADLIIPATETPGALDAQVPRFVERMAADWLDEGERGILMAGLVALDREGGTPFAALPPEQQLAQLEALEEAASDSSWYDMGNITRVWESEAPFICQFKELVVMGFFFSEVGATQVLRQNPMGSFQGDIPLAEDDTTYAAITTVRSMAKG